MTEVNPTPSTSVIIIFLNAGAFIEEAIESVRSQTESDWELLLVDDGSTDSSTQIARKFAQRHPDRIRYLQHADQQNHGMSASRNLGIANARGDYIAFLDADDIWLPNWLERHLAVLTEHDEVGMVYSPTLYWHSWADASETQDSFTDRVGDLGLDPGRPLAPPTVLLSYLESGGGNLPGICSVLSRRQVVERVGGFEDSFRGLFEDQVFLSKMCIMTTVFVLDEVLDKYRQHPESHCSMAAEAGHYHPVAPNPAREQYLNWLEGYFRENDVRDRRLLAALKRELRPYRHPWLYALSFRALKRMPGLNYAKSVARRSLPTSTYAWLGREYRRQLMLGRRS